MSIYKGSLLEIQQLLEDVRETIRKVAPDANEVISYSMPGYKLNGMLVPGMPI
ncbi:MAG TPA: DUF1801 domain-containing protein [Bacteroidales bacterium]